MLTRPLPSNGRKVRIGTQARNDYELHRLYGIRVYDKRIMFLNVGSDIKILVRAENLLTRGQHRDLINLLLCLQNTESRPKVHILLELISVHFC
jgi:hypothetical protein